MAYFPCPIFRSTDDYSIMQQGGTKVFDQPVFLIDIRQYPFEAYDNWLTIEYPNGETGERYGLSVDEAIQPYIFLPAGTKVTAHNCTITWFYVTWVKVPELVSGGGGNQRIFKKILPAMFIVRARGARHGGQSLKSGCKS